MSGARDVLSPCYLERRLLSRYRCRNRLHGRYKDGLSGTDRQFLTPKLDQIDG